MPAFGTESTRKLSTCHPDLQRLFNEVVKHVDCSVICGFRNEADQNSAVKAGNSKISWPNGKHNSNPSRAVDVMPYPVDWSDSKANVEHLNHFAGMVRGIAMMMGIGIRWGHDWNRDMVPDEKGLVDRPHYELT